MFLSLVAINYFRHKNKTKKERRMRRSLCLTSRLSQTLEYARNKVWAPHAVKINKKKLMCAICSMCRCFQKKKKKDHYGGKMSMRGCHDVCAVVRHVNAVFNTCDILPVVFTFASPCALSIAFSFLFLLLICNLNYFFFYVSCHTHATLMSFATSVWNIDTILNISKFNKLRRIQLDRYKYIYKASTHVA